MAVATKEAESSLHGTSTLKRSPIYLGPIHSEEVLFSGMRLKEWPIQYIVEAMLYRIKALSYGKNYGTQVSKLNLPETVACLNRTVTRYNLHTPNNRINLGNSIIRPL